MSNPPKKALRWDPTADQNNAKKSKRSKLHVSSTVDWLKKRHKNTANMQYLLPPNELRQHKEVQKIFEVFDEDNSGKLTLDEFYNMLRQAHITIKMEDLQEFYAKVDDNRDEALDFTEFKNSTLSEQANFHFGRMMAKVRTEAEAQLQIRKNEKKAAQKSKRETEKTEGDSEKPDSERVYLPRTFGNLLNFLTYENKKHDLINFVKGNNSLGDKFKKFSQLLELQMDKDIYLEKLNQRFQNKMSSTRSTQSLSPTRIEKVVQPKATKNFSPSDSESEENEEPAPKEIKEEEKPKVKPKFFQELTQISENARKEAHQEFFQEVRRKDKHVTMPPVSKKEVGSTNDLTHITHKTTRKSLFLPQPLYPRFEEDVKGADHEHMTSIMNPTYDATLDHHQNGSSNYIPSSTNIRNTPQSQFFKTQLPRSVTHSKTSTPKRPQRTKLAGIVGGGTRSSSLIPKAGADSSEGRPSTENHHESIMTQPSKVVFNDYNFASQPSYRDQSQTKNHKSHKFIPSFSDLKSPKDQQQAQAQISSKILEARISTYNETQGEISLPILSPKGSLSLLKSQRESINQNTDAQLSTFSKNKPRVSLNIPIQEEGQEEVFPEKVTRKASRMPTDYTCVSPHYDHALNKATTDKRRAKTFLMKIVPNESAARLTSPKSCTNQLAKARALASVSQAEIKRDSSQSEVKKVDLNFTVQANFAGEKERPKGKRVFTTTTKRSSLKPGVVNQVFDPIRSTGIESKYMIPSLGIDK